MDFKKFVADLAAMYRKPTEPTPRGTVVDVDAAHEAGRKVGYEAGHAEGYEAGRKVGHDAGHAEGYEAGREAGQEAGYEKRLRKGLRRRLPNRFRGQDATGTTAATGTAIATGTATMIEVG